MPEAVYQFVSVPKQSNNQGMPNGKKNVVIIFEFDKVKTFTPDSKGVKLTAFDFVTSYTPIGLFVDESSIDAGDELGGEAYGRGWNHKFVFNHPGDDLEFAEFKQNNVNAPLGAIYIPCKPGSTIAKVYGTPCAPLHMTKADEVDTNAANRQEVELKTEILTSTVHRVDISDIPVTDNADMNSYLGLGGGGV